MFNPLTNNSSKSVHNFLCFELPELSSYLLINRICDRRLDRIVGAKKDRK